MSAHRPTRRRVLGGIAAATGTSFALHSATPSAADVLGEPHAIDVHAQPIANFAQSHPGTRRFGDLEFRGGLVLTSSSQHFGGWSGLAIDEGGRGLLLVSDKGTWLSGRLDYDGERPTGISRARIGPLKARSGRVLQQKRDQDAESLALVDGTLQHGTVLIGFERLHRIGRFPVRNGEVQAPSTYLGLPSEAKRMQPNQGLEALTVLKGGPLRGSLVALAERFTRGSGYHTGWIWVRGEPRSFHLKDIDGFNITGAAGLPDGGLLVLERYFRWLSGVKMRIRRISAEELRPGARVDGQILLEVGSDHEIDNMEGICIHRGEQGEVIVSLISDDNFNRFLQRTIFLQFTFARE